MSIKEKMEEMKEHHHLKQDFRHEQKEEKWAEQINSAIGKKIGNA